MWPTSSLVSCSIYRLLNERVYLLLCSLKPTDHQQRPRVTTKLSHGRENRNSTNSENNANTECKVKCNQLRRFIYFFLKNEKPTSCFIFYFIKCSHKYHHHGRADESCCDTEVMYLCIDVINLHIDACVHFRENYNCAGSPLHGNKEMKKCIRLNYKGK